MDNYLLFKQAVCLILFFEALVLWPRFKLFFGPPIFPKSVFTTPLRIFAFNVVLLTSLIFLFLNYYPVFAAFILCLCMRYLFVTETNNRISTFGAVGHICYLVVVYIFFFECALAFDPSHQLTDFLLTIFAIEMGVILLTAGIYKYVLGYTKGRGFDLALVNPNWGKFFFLFNKMKPASWFFTINNYAAFLSEILAGLLFLLPQTRMIGAYLLLAIFLYVFLLIRVNVLPLLMMSIALLYIQPILFHFPILHETLPDFAISHDFIVLIEVLFIAYLTLYIFVSSFRILQYITNISPPAFLVKPLEIFIAARPFFAWSVFTYELTRFFIKIQKVSKSEDKTTAILYDGFSKNYGEIFDDPRMFFRFIHHHEFSLLLTLFTNILSTPEEDSANNKYFKQLLDYASTFLSESEQEDTALVFSVISIKKLEDEFLYLPMLELACGCEIKHRHSDINHGQSR